MTSKSTLGIDLHEKFARSLDWNLLRTFIAIVQYGGISKAAERIYLSQPAVSQALQRLEAHLDLNLIVRDARRFEITEAGEVVYAKAIEIHNQVSRLGYVRSPDHRELTGHLRLMLASRLESKVLDQIIEQFVDQNPAISVSLDVASSSDIIAMIHQGTACAGFCLMRNRSAELESELILRQKFGIYCGKSHRFFGRTSVHSSALAKSNFITFASDQIGGELSPLAIYREQHVFEGRVIATSNNLDEIIRLTRLGIGLGLLPMHVAQSHGEEGRLWRLPPHRGIGPIDIHLVWNPATEFSEVERAFLHFARSHLKKIPLNERA